MCSVPFEGYGVHARVTLLRRRGCADESKIEAYVMNKLTAEEVSAFEEHVLICARCQDSVSHCEIFVSNLRRALAACPSSAARKLRLVIDNSRHHTPHND